MEYQTFETAITFILLAGAGTVVLAWISFAIADRI